jgi:hypothetical protein
MKDLQAFFSATVANGKPRREGGREKVEGRGPWLNSQYSMFNAQFSSGLRIGNILEN